MNKVYTDASHDQHVLNAQGQNSWSAQT